MAGSQVQVLQTAANLDSTDLSCRICLQVLDKPVRLPCSHRFCKDCIQPVIEGKSHADCPICRETFDCGAIDNDDILKFQLSSSQIRCEVCQQLVSAQAMRNHEQSCRSGPVKVQFVPPGNRVAPDAPNRATFNCPHCAEPNLTGENLVDHCNKLHKQDRRDVVCPVCVSMPWGDPQQTSSNFIEHLNRRHKFEYDTFVDYGQSDDEMLQAALAASLSDW